MPTVNILAFYTVHCTYAYTYVFVVVVSVILGISLKYMYAFDLFLLTLASVSTWSESVVMRWTQPCDINPG